VCVSRYAACRWRYSSRFCVLAAAGGWPPNLKCTVGHVSAHTSCWPAQSRGHVLLLLPSSAVKLAAGRVAAPCIGAPSLFGCFVSCTLPRLCCCCRCCIQSHLAREYVFETSEADHTQAAMHALERIALNGTGHCCIRCRAHLHFRLRYSCANCCSYLWPTVQTIVGFRPHLPHCPALTNTCECCAFMHCLRNLRAVQSFILLTCRTALTRAGSVTITAHFDRSRILKTPPYLAVLLKDENTCRRMQQVRSNNKSAMATHVGNATCSAPSSAHPRLTATHCLCCKCCRRTDCMQYSRIRCSHTPARLEIGIHTC
jgi:hypothetical protein